MVIYSPADVLLEKCFSPPAPLQLLCSSHVTAPVAEDLAVPRCEMLIHCVHKPWRKKKKNKNKPASPGSCLHIVNTALSPNQWHSALANKSLRTINTRQLHKGRRCLDTHIPLTLIARNETVADVQFWPIDCVFASVWGVHEYRSAAAEIVICSECGQRRQDF